MHPMAAYAALHGLVPCVVSRVVQGTVGDAPLYRIHTALPFDRCQYQLYVSDTARFEQWAISQRSDGAAIYLPIEWGDMPDKLLDRLTAADIHALVARIT